MRREVATFLYDILRAGNLIRSFTQGRTFDQFREDLLLQSAVERQFEVVGEALHKAVQADTTLGQRITAPGRVIALRNRLIHGYASVSAAVVWGVIESHLAVPQLPVDW